MQSTWQNPESGNLDPSEWDRSTAIPTNMAFSRKQPPQLLDLQPVPEDGAHKKLLVRCDSCLQLACGVDFRLLHPTTTTHASLSSPATLTLFSDLFLGSSVPGPVPRLWNCPPHLSPVLGICCLPLLSQLEGTSSSRLGLGVFLCGIPDLGCCPDTVKQTRCIPQALEMPPSIVPGKSRSQT